MLFDLPAPEALSGATLAYLGDAVFELIVRQFLLTEGKTDVGELNKKALSYVKAAAQSEAVERLLPQLREEELAAFKRGRNCHGLAIPKSASAGQYHRATGLEALFAFLFLRGENERMKELFTLGFPPEKEEPEEKE